MPIGRNNELDVKTFTDCVGFGLFQAVIGRQAFSLGFNQGQRHRLGIGGYFYPQDIIYATLGAFTRFTIHNFHRPSAFLAPDQILRPALGVDGGINQFSACFGLVERHVFIHGLLLGTTRMSCNKI